MKPSVLILVANGTNRDLDLAQAFELAGARPHIVPINALRKGIVRFDDFQILAIPGGFSYADALGAGKLLALDLRAFFKDEVGRLIEQGKPVIGICNGFQALVSSGLLPGNTENHEHKQATLTFNSSGRFECRWISMKPQSQKCVWTRGLTSIVYCPVAHGEGNFRTASPQLSNQLIEHDQVALTYITDHHQPASGAYPANPNGSELDIAGICNSQGNVLGLMPHPENHIFPFQHPRWTRGESDGSGLIIFKNGVQYCQ